MSKYMITDITTNEVVYTELPYQIYGNAKMYIDLTGGDYIKSENEMMRFLAQVRTPIGAYDMTATLVGDVTYNIPTLTHIISLSNEVQKYILVYSDTEKYEFQDFNAVKQHIAGIGTDLAMLQIDNSNNILLMTSVDSLLDYAKAQIYTVDRANTVMNKVCVMRIK